MPAKGAISSRALTWLNLPVNLAPVQMLEAIEKYSLQQFQTKKNDEYRALAHEIEMAKEAIVKLEDQQLELMEQAEAAQKEAAATARVAEESKKVADKLLADLANRDQNLKK